MKRTLILFLVGMVLVSACVSNSTPQPTPTVGLPPTLTPSPGPTSTPTRTATPEKARLEDLVISRDQLGELGSRFQRMPYFEQGITPNDALGVGESLIATFINQKNAGNISVYLTRCVDNAGAQYLISLSLTLLQGEKVDHEVVDALPGDAVVFTASGKTGILFTYQELLLGVLMDDALANSGEERISLVQEIAVKQLEKVKADW